MLVTLTMRKFQIHYKYRYASSFRMVFDIEAATEEEACSEFWKTRSPDELVYIQKIEEVEEFPTQMEYEFTYRYKNEPGTITTRNTIKAYSIHDAFKVFFGGAFRPHDLVVLSMKELGGGEISHNV